MSASDPSSLGASPSPSASSSTPFLPRLIKSLSVQYQVYLDKSVPLSTFRWLLFTGFVFLYFLRVYAVEGFYIVTYGLGIFLLNLFIGFLSPLDEEMLDEGRGPMLPLSDDAEFKPFVRRLPEFKFWHSCLKAVIVALLMTLFPMFDVPVFWPILLIYFIILFILTMRRQIQHMIKHKYLPFNLGKKKYQKGGGPAGTAGGGLAAMLGTATGGAGAGGQKMKVAEDIRTR